MSACSLIRWADRYQPVWLEHLRLARRAVIRGTDRSDWLAARGNHEWAPEAVFVELVSKIDETRTHGVDYMMMEGYSARLFAWNRFERRWRKHLRNHGLDYFHAHEHATHPFAPKAHKLIETHLMFGFVVRVDARDFKDVYRSGAWGGKAQPDSMYGLCFRYCLSFVLQQALVEFPNRPDLVLNFVVEDGHPNAGAPTTIVTELKKKRVSGMSEFLGNALPGEKKKIPGLQAADALAYMAQRWEDQNPLKIGIPQDSAIEALRPQAFTKVPIFYCHADAEELASFRDGYFEHIRRRQAFGQRKPKPNPTSEDA